MNRLHRAPLALSLVAFVAAGCGSTAHLDHTPRPATTPAQATPAAATATATPAATAAQLSAGHWSTLPAAPIPPRVDASVVWTGSELLVWGGGEHDDGAAYDPATGRWRVLPASPLSPRDDQAAVWTGTEMIVWGGFDGRGPLGDGAAYDPSSNTWRKLPAAPLSPRAGAVAVWTGSRVLLLGGEMITANGAPTGYTDGATYDPATGRWQHVAPPTAPAGHGLSWQTAVAAGGQVLVWSGWSSHTTSSASGGEDLFSTTPTVTGWRSVPQPEQAIPNVEEVLSTGAAGIVRGLPYNCGICPGPAVAEVTAIDDPATNRWTRLPADPVAVMGAQVSSAWTGAALFSFNAEAQSGPTQPGDASAYDPSAGRWVRLPRAPAGCAGQVDPVWTGHQVLVVCPSGRSSGVALTPSSS